MQSFTAGAYGSVCTISSETVGSSARICSSISLARECASASGTAGSSPSVRKTTSPSVGLEEAQLARRGARCSRDDRGDRPPRHGRPRRRRRAAPLLLPPAARDASAPRRPPGPPRSIACSTSLAARCASSSDESPGSFRCSETSVRPSTCSTLMLWISRTRRTFIAAAFASSRMTASSSVGSTWTTTSVSGSARSTAASTASAAACPCPTAAVGRDADHDVGEVPAGGGAHSKSPQLDLGLESPRSPGARPPRRRRARDPSARRRSAASGAALR